jgi:uncharacterized membrane protein
MKNLGRTTVYIGIFLSAIGLILGFAAMFTGWDKHAVVLLNVIPIGFVLMLAGTVASQFSNKNKDNNK